MLYRARSSNQEDIAGTSWSCQGIVEVTYAFQVRGFVLKSLRLIEQTQHAPVPVHAADVKWNAAGLAFHSVVHQLVLNSTHLAA